MAIAGYNPISTAQPSSSVSSGQSTSNGYNQSQNASQGSSASQSTSFIPNYSQTPILESIAQYAEGMAPQVYQWGMDTYGKNQGSIDDLMRTAETYGSGQRLAADMGMAESGVQQAGAKALENSKQDLESYGIDPSSGRYAALDQASKVQTAAAAAGAGNQQYQADIATGNAMKNQAISASLQNANFGLGVGADANNFLSTAMRLPYSPLGTQSSSSSQQSSEGMSQGVTSSQSTNDSSSRGATPTGGGGSGGGSGGAKPSSSGGGGDPTGSGAGSAPRGISGGSGPSGSLSGGSSGGGSDGSGSQTDPWYDGTPGVGVYPGDNGGSSWDAYNPGGTGGTFDTGLPGGGAGSDTGGWDQGATWSDPGFSGDWGYAAGGPVDDDQEMQPGYDPDQDGQMVHPGMSPSSGQEVDDVPAKLNAGEFVMPDDVVRWKGEEFFQGLIAKSRQAREGIMAAHGQMQGQPPQGANLGGAI
jgi:hypothetical protein